MSWFSQGRVKFPQQWGGKLYLGYSYIMLTSHPGMSAGRIGDRVGWRSWFFHCCIGIYFALFIVITVIVIVCCVAVALLY